MNGPHKAIFHNNMQLEAQLDKQVELEVKLEALFILANLMDEIVQWFVKSSKPVNEWMMLIT